MFVSILGTKYEIKESTESKDANLNGVDGYCDTSTKVCVVEEMNNWEPGSKGNLSEYKKQVMRHEIVHGFLHESGLDINTWATNEEKVEWIAIQFPKIMQAFKECDCL